MGDRLRRRLQSGVFMTVGLVWLGAAIYLTLAPLGIEPTAANLWRPIAIFVAPLPVLVVLMALIPDVRRTRHTPRRRAED